MIPEPFELALLALAAFRLWKLIGDDIILDGPRDFLVERAERAGYGQSLLSLLVCPWCSGAWISLGWWLAWYAFPTGALVAATPFAISAIVGLVGVRAEPE